MNTSKPAVSICIVTHDSAGDLPDCLTAVARLRYRPLELIVVDCASRDASPAIARRQAPQSLATRIIELRSNLGFSGGMNRALAESSAPFILALNPDARPRPDFLERLLSRANRTGSERVGAIAGRLLRPAVGSLPVEIDACGMRLLPTWRHLDRGSGAVDHGQLMEPRRVFGASAAAALYRRAALEDVAVEGELFATEFHTYREDAELCFRLRERGWEILYEPTAICVHRRRNLPGRRRSMSAEINFHSLKNRYLLRAYHQDLTNFVLTLLPALWRDLLALTWVIAMERSSLRAYAWLWRHRRLIARRRRLIQDRRTCRSADLNRWFLRESLPL